MAIPRSFLSGINLSGVLQLSSAPGTSGQVLTSQGAGNTPSWTSASSLVFTTGTLSLGANLTTQTGAIVLTGQAGGSSVTIPTSGTLLTTTGSGSSLTFGTGSLSLAGNFTTSGAFATTLTMTAATALTLPTSGTVVATGPNSVSGTGTAVSLVGGASTGTTGQSGGAVNITGGASTSGTSTNTGGTVNITGGASNTSAGIGGSININGGLGSVSNGNGSISIGTSNTDTITLGAAGKTLFFDSTPLLRRVDATSEGGQIDFARSSDNTGYWRIDSFGTAGTPAGSTPDIRIIENATERFRIATGGAATLSSSLTTGGALNLNYASPTISSNNASAASIFTGTVTGITIGSSTIKTTQYPADATTATAASGGGFMGMPQNSTTTGAYTIVAADAGKHIYSTASRTVTIPANSSVAFPIGTTITFVSGASTTTTIAITTDTMYLAGSGTTGSRTLASWGMATAVKLTSTIWIISGNGLT